MKFQKTITSIFSLLILVSFFTFPVSAKNNSSISFNNNVDALKFVETSTSVNLKNGDTFITKDAIEVGLKYAKLNENSSNEKKMLNNVSSESIVPLSSGYETWTITSAVTVVPYGVVKGNYSGKLAAGVTDSSTFNFSIGISGSIKGVTIDASATWSTSTSYSGPTGTEVVASGYYATQRVFSALASASVVRYTYRVTDQYTGAYLRTEYRNYAANKSINTYANLVNINPSTGQFKIRSASSSASLTLSSESVWYAKVNSTNNPQTYVYF